jgi:hypothetical protein
VLVREELAKQQVTFCHTLHTHLVLHHVISFSSLLERKAMRTSISVGRGDGKLHGTFLQISFSSYTKVGRLAQQPTATAEGGCEYLVTWCDKTSPQNY